MDSPGILSCILSSIWTTSCIELSGRYFFTNFSPRRTGITPVVLRYICQNMSQSGREKSCGYIPYSHVYHFPKRRVGWNWYSLKLSEWWLGYSSIQFNKKRNKFFGAFWFGIHFRSSIALARIFSGSYVRLSRSFASSTNQRGRFSVVKLSYTRLNRVSSPMPIIPWV